MSPFRFLWLCCAFLVLLHVGVYAGQPTISAKKKKTPCKRTAFNRRTTNYQAWKEQMTICELLENYDPAVRPSGGDPQNRKGPVIVTTSLFVSAVSAVSERNMEYVAQFRFQQEWFDNRLAFADQSGFRNFDFINIARDQQLWIPDSFFQNERNGHYHMLDQENRYVRVRSDGKVIYLIWYGNTASSDAYTTADIIYQWDKVGIEVAPTASGALPNFELSRLTNATCDSVTNTGIYSCLRVQLTLRRVFSFFLLQLYIPSAMLVGVSWVSYWIDWKSTAARVPLAIVTLLTMITQSHAINSNLPPVSYAKSIDIWVGGCVVFIFGYDRGFEVNYMGILDEHKQMRKITLNRTRLSNVAGNRINWESENSSPNHSPAFTNSKEKKKNTNVMFRGTAVAGGKSILRRRRKLRLQYSDSGEDDNMVELTSVHVPSTTKELLRQGEPNWTMQDLGDLVYVGQRKRVELIRWCSLLSERGRAERIDIIARIIFPVAFGLFNIAYWSIYLGDDELGIMTKRE